MRKAARETCIRYNADVGRSWSYWTNAEKSFRSWLQVNIPAPGWAFMTWLQGIVESFPAHNNNNNNEVSISAQSDIAPGCRMETFHSTNRILYIRRVAPSARESLSSNLDRRAR